MNARSLRGHPLVFRPANLIHRVGQMAQHVEFVEQNLGLRRVRLHRVAEGLPHVHHGQSNPGRLLGAQVDKEAVQVGFGPACAHDPDGPTCSRSLTTMRYVWPCLIDRSSTPITCGAGWGVLANQARMYWVSRSLTACSCRCSICATALFDMSRHKMPTWWANRCV